MNRFLFLLFIILPVYAFADQEPGIQYFNDMVALFEKGDYENALNGFEYCIEKFSSVVSEKNCNYYISECDKKIANKRAEIVAKKKALEKEAADQAKADSIRKIRQEERNLIYISTYARTLTGEYTTMKSAIKGNLKQFKSWPTEEEARWGIYINANAREYSNPNNDPFGNYMIYVDAVCQICDLLTGEIIFENKYSPKDGSPNLTQAIDKVYKKLINTISDDIKANINL